MKESKGLQGGYTIHLVLPQDQASYTIIDTFCYLGDLLGEQGTK